jgi:hypothetical protein
MEILRFISAVFYGGPEKLTAAGQVPSVVEITPLVFYTVQVSLVSFLNKQTTLVRHEVR